MHTPPGTPVHCIQLWSCQIDVVSGAILQEGSWVPRWKELMVFLLINSTSPQKKKKKKKTSSALIQIVVVLSLPMTIKQDLLPLRSEARVYSNSMQSLVELG